MNKRALATLESLPDYGDHMTLENFLDCVKTGLFIDYDGHGCYATATQMTNKIIRPCDREVDHSYSHVVWFNK
jgi:hypothetical protein